MSFGARRRAAHELGARRRRRRADLPAGGRATASPSGTPRTSTASASSEEITGRAIKEYTRREDVVLATKVLLPDARRPGRLRACPARRSWSRSTPRCAGSAPTTSTSTRSTASTPNTPVEETMEALHDVVKAGKARYLGASSMWAWQFASMQHAADAQRLDAVRLDAEPVQPPPARGGARDVRPARATRASAASRGARSPRAAWPGPGASSTRRSRERRPPARGTTTRANPPIVAAVQQVAEARGVPMAQVALAWVLQQPGRRRADRRTHQGAAPHRRRRGASTSSSPTSEVDGARGAVHAAVAVRLPVTTHGVSFPVDATGERSTTSVARDVVADALRAVDPVGADAAARETAWRSRYLLHFRRLVEAGLPSADAWHAIADAGLDARTPPPGRGRRRGRPPAGVPGRRARDETARHRSRCAAAARP